MLQINYNKEVKCNNCPRNCNIDRGAHAGFCGTSGVTLSRVGKHFWEEPCISGEKGSGTVFFAGCNLKCRFCQNYGISLRPHGVEVTAERLADVFLYLQDEGVANINLVTPSHVILDVTRALTLAKPKLHVPVVYNTSSYEKVEHLRQLQDLVDVYLPDLKFASREVSKALCGVEDYFDVATQAITEMARQQPQNVFENGYITKGLIVRHLVLPSFVEDSKRILDWLAHFNKDTYVSLMSQYFPAKKDDKFLQLNRKLYKHEYESVLQYFFNVGLKNGFMQDATSATVDYLPEFCDSAVAELLNKVPKIFAEQ